MLPVAVTGLGLLTEAVSVTGLCGGTWLEERRSEVTVTEDTTAKETGVPDVSEGKLFPSPR